jgi:hypothetical protein
MRKDIPPHSGTRKKLMRILIPHQPKHAINKNRLLGERLPGKKRPSEGATTIPHSLF